MVKGRTEGMNLKYKSRIGKYELGRTLGEGSFAKVKSAVNVETGQSFAVKILDKDNLFHYKIVDHFKREICNLKLIKHPNVVRLYEVLATKKRIYIVLELVNGGELFEQVFRNGKLEENEARKYFQQLIDAVGYCHSRGVYHRDLKLENVLLDENGNIKISDFGLSAVPQQFREDGLLHTTCGSPNYVAPEVIAGRGYDGATADVWSSGVILFVLLAGWLPFDDNNLVVLYHKIFKGEFKFPKGLSAGARRLIKEILNPNPKTRISLAEIVEHEWFKKGYSPAKFVVENNTCLDDVDAAFTNSEYSRDYNDRSLSPFLKFDTGLAQRISPDFTRNSFYSIIRDHMFRDQETGPIMMNAFQLIAMSRSLDLSGFFEEEDAGERKTRFISMCPAQDIMRRIEETAKAMRFQVERKNSKLNLLHINPKGKAHLSVEAELFEVSPCLHVVELRKSAGDIGQFKELCSKLSSDLSLQENITCGGIEAE